MSEKCNDVSMTYTISKLSETAKTFRRLGEAYECGLGGETEHEGPSFKRQLFLVADILDDCTMMQMHANICEKNVIREISAGALKAGIRVKNIQELIDKNGSKKMIMLAKTFGRGCISEKKLRKILCGVQGCEYFSDRDNHMVINERYHQYIYHQEERFKLLTGTARLCKEKENLNGDNFMTTKLACGKMVAAIADGCGSGRQAFIESRMVIELMENCIDAGFEEKTAIDLINSAYISGGGMGNPVTMDMSIIDCQSGILHCIKLGAVSTFIKRDGWVEIIKSATLPMGVLEQVDYDCTIKKLYDNDYVIMLSDGVLDNIPCVNKEEKMVDIINSIHMKNPKAIADEILKQSLSYNNCQAFDDCTVLVMGLFDTYDN